MDLSDRHFQTRLAQDDRDIAAVQRLRYEVFVRELGAEGPGIDHGSAREIDPLDAYADHLMLEDLRRPGEPRLVGVYRLMRGDQARRAGGFCAEAEFDLSPILDDCRAVMELGRACLHRDHRGGAGVMRLWQGLARYTERHGIDRLFGVSSFPGTDPHAIAEPLAYLHHHHRLPAGRRPRAHPCGAVALDLLPPEAIDRKRAVATMPPLLKGYLRLGGAVGDSAYIDHAFNCIDVCLVLDTARLSARQRARYVPAAV